MTRRWVGAAVVQGSRLESGPASGPDRAVTGSGPRAVQHTRSTRPTTTSSLGLWNGRRREGWNPAGPGAPRAGAASPQRRGAHRWPARPPPPRGTVGAGLRPGHGKASSPGSSHEGRVACSPEGARPARAGRPPDLSAHSAQTRWADGCACAIPLRRVFPWSSKVEFARTLDKLLREGRHQDFSGAGSVSQSACDNDRVPEVVVALVDGVAGVHADVHGDGLSITWREYRWRRRAECRWHNAGHGRRHRRRP